MFMEKIQCINSLRVFMVAVHNAVSFRLNAPNIRKVVSTDGKSAVRVACPSDNYQALNDHHTTIIDPRLGRCTHTNKRHHK